MTRTGLFLTLLFFLGGCADSVTDIVRYGAVDVRAARRTGEAVPAVRAFLYNGTFIMDEGVTDAEGNYRFEYVPPNILGDYGVYAEPPPGYLRPEEVVGGPSTASIGGIRVEEGGEGTASFTYVKAGPGRMEVSVFEADGAAVEGAEVFLFGAEGELGQASVGASGVVVFDPVSFGNRAVRVVPPSGYLSDPEEFGLVADGILVDEGWTESVHFSLEKCPGTIRGEVLDQFGAPASMVPLRLYTASEIVETRQTDGDGVVLFEDVGCQEYGLTLLPAPGWEWEEGRGESFFDGILMTPGDDRAFTFQVQRRSAEIRVLVEDQDGIPVPGARLELYISQGPWEEGTTGADGRVTFSQIPAGQEYGVKILPLSGYSVVEGKGSSFFDGLIPEVDETLSLTFVLTRL